MKKFAVKYDKKIAGHYVVRKCIKNNYDASQDYKYLHSTENALNTCIFAKNGKFWIVTE